MTYSYSTKLRKKPRIIVPETPLAHVQPVYLVLDTGEELFKLRKQTEHFDFLFPNDKRLAEMLVQTLAYQKDAEHELSFMCLDQAYDIYGTGIMEVGPSKTFEQVSGLLHRFGMHLFHQVLANKLYRNGYLPYSVHGLIGADVVLRRLELDVDPNM